MKQKVAFINAFPRDTFLREFNFADYFYTFSGNNQADQAELIGICQIGTFGLFSGLYGNFFCLEPLKQTSLDLIALRIFFL